MEVEDPPPVALEEGILGTFVRGPGRPHKP